MIKSYLLIITFCSLFFQSFSQWEDLNTGINDDLTGVVFRGDTGLVSGHKGLYYTTTGGLGSASWSPYSIVGNSSDSLIYKRTKFSNCFSSALDSTRVYACGQDTINNQAVIFQLTMGSWSHQLLYVGAIGSHLEDINYSDFSSNYYAVGNNGLCVRFAPSTMGIEESLGITTDLTSVSFEGSSFWIGANGRRIFGTDNNPGLTITTNDLIPSWDVKDVLCLPGGMGFGVGGLAYHIDGMNYENLTYYDFAPLNATSTAMKFNYRFIGTDHGIYRTYLNTTPSQSNPFEWQYSSEGYSINEMWNEDDPMDLYACGTNGTILKTENYDFGGNSKPYVSIEMGSNEGCEDEVTTLYSHMGSADYGIWYVNGELVSTSDHTYSHNYDSAGVYEVNYIGTSTWIGSDTATFMLEITATPFDSINFSIADTIICHSESVDIVLDSSESNVFYTLYGLDGESYGNSQVGNGGPLNYSSDPVSDSGSYYIMASSSVNPNCRAQLLQPIQLAGEWTTADFKVSHINCEPNESIKFFNQCKDAANYSWTFETNASTSTSNLLEPLNSYTSPSTPDSVKLICWSNNGCYDTIYKNGPNIELLPTVIDTSWVNANQSPIEAPYAIDPEIHRMIPVQDGYLISGEYYEETFASRYGDSISYSGAGGFILKYDFRGMLKWSMYTDGVIQNMTEDQNGNIYLTGTAEEIFVDNSNDTIFLPDETNYDLKGFLIKLDSLGEIQWYRRSFNIYPYHVSIGEDNLPVVGASTRDHIPGKVTLDFNHTPMDTMAVSTGVYSDHIIMKFDENGTLLWDVPMTIEGGNISTIRDIELDSDNNIYITGAFEHRVVTYATNSSVGDEISGYVSVYGGHVFLTKLNEAGGLLWQTKSISINDQSAVIGGSAPYDMVIDDNGNCYISGKNECYNSTMTFQFHNTDGTFFNGKGGETFFMKVDSNGICSWMKNGKYTYRGAISRLHLENDKIYALGWIDEMSWYSGTPTITYNNDDSTAIIISMERPNYYIATFDTTGYIHSVFKNSDDDGALPVVGLVTDWAGFFKHSDGSFYTTRNILINNNTTYDEFGHTMTTDDFDSWVIKAKPGNGIDVPPIYLVQVEDSICNGDNYSLPDGTIITPATDLIDTTTLMSVSGMDSIIITDLNIVYPITTYDSVNVCPGSTYIFPDGSSSVITSQTTQTNNYVSSFGCDSIVTTVVDLHPSQYITEHEYVCKDSEYVFPDGTTMVISESTDYISYFTNIEGCDSIIETDVDLFPAINASVTINGGILEASPGGLIYQWLNCDTGFTPIANETSPTYTPSTNGSYAVEVLGGACKDTSSCELIDFTGLGQESLLTFEVSPNPADDEFYIYFNQGEHTIVILDLLGREVMGAKKVKSGDRVDVHALAPGQYFVTTEDGNIGKRIVIK